jgi:hypothetical protein
MNELAELAKLDGLVGGKREEATNMQSAMSKNEKIRDWVSEAAFMTDFEVLFFNHEIKLIRFSKLC